MKKRHDGYAIKFSKKGELPLFYAQNDNADWAMTDGPYEAHVFVTIEEAMSAGRRAQQGAFEVVAIQRFVEVSVTPLSKVEEAAL